MFQINGVYKHKSASSDWRYSW